MDDTFEKAKKAAGDAADSLKDKFQDWKGAPSSEEIRVLAKELAEDASAFVRKYPLQSLAGALAAGFLLGAFIQRRRD